MAPILAACGDGQDRAWLATCWPGESELSRYRLYPGSLHLLWLEALGRPADEGDARVAAGLECLHNASLHHDDVLDDHDSRRGAATLRGRQGASAALLAGDGLAGFGFALLAGAGEARIVERAASAWLRMTRGQLMDEPSSWQRVDAADRARHWEETSEAKLALGNVAAPLAALRAGRAELAAPLEELHQHFSVVSQIMNDLGDREGWAGFHAIAPCHRPRGEESLRKPTYSSIRTRQAAEEEVERRTTIALERLRALDVATSVRPLLTDFFQRPLAELRKTAGVAAS
ncbi:MAG TPA: polyprenyl synthetase family protein [Thermoanaerobaculia bacterium]|nr:polyprenyl synthetase family protein [Thermoanaerobaculia bacterium]